MRWDWVVNNAGRIGDLAWAHFSLSWPAILASFLIACRSAGSPTGTRGSARSS